ncbi:hypothetical protein I8748_20470 [Nostoc sp. CENA67]|uniref:Uncharacterized protein n=1 Tax=Amazonocrinis nigriterrae CENA67 TaxID=2794033 RepID=A0A8J7HVX1_9NOST|nr:hypothetical protein [Amazonocrinis nigriterrae]MBH8564528.1 hypothetical protein [Amazonocrinis nigriterrae CENA67]
MTIKKENPMKNLGQMTDQQQHLVVLRLAVATSILIVSLAPTAILAKPPATEASCEGIKAAYPILGKECSNQYSKIEHNLTNAKDRLETYYARVSVLEIFRKALICNGMFGANKQAQDRFKSGEQGHLQALNNLVTAMTAAKDPNIPPTYDAKKLQSVTIKKVQCK